MTELSAILISFFAFGAGVIAGWIQRDKQKALDAMQLAQAILRSCEVKEEVKLRRIK